MRQERAGPLPPDWQAVAGDGEALLAAMQQERAEALAYLESQWEQLFAYARQDLAVLREYPAELAGPESRKAALNALAAMQASIASLILEIHATPQAPAEGEG